MATLVTAKGIEFQVDDEDVERVSAHKWEAIVERGIPKYVATYERVSFNKRRTVYLHRFVMNAPKGVEIDHKNLDRFDCRKGNLRSATRQEQCRNMPKVMRTGTTSIYKGVSWRRDMSRWEARIHVDRKRKRLGFHANEEDAARAYDRAARELFGEFARTNFETA